MSQIIDTRSLESKFNRLACRIGRRNDVFTKKPRENTNTGELYKRLQDNYASGITTYTLEEVTGLLLQYIKKSFNHNDVLLNKVNNGDKEYKFFFENDGLYYFITPESIVSQKIAISWKAKKIKEPFHVGYYHGGQYHWDFSKIKAMLYPQAFPIELEALEPLDEERKP